jgi:CDP-paratose 2-epimerase
VQTRVERKAGIRSKGNFMKILITGGAGFIGCNLADYFLKKGYEVIVFDNLSRSGTEKNLKWLKDNHKKGLSFIKGDVRNFKSLIKACKDVDAIFHTAAQVAVTTSLKNPREDFEINALGTFNVLEAARRSNGNPIVIYTSTNKVYGNNVNKIRLIEKETRYEFADKRYKNGIPEDFPTDANEHTPYGCSKYAAEIYVRDYGAVYGLRTVTFRMSCIYGTRQFGNEDQGYLAHFVISTILGKPITIYGTGKQVRDNLFITDLLEAFDLAVKNIEKVKGKVFNVGGGHKNTSSLLELIDLLEKITGKKSKITFSEWRPFDQLVYISNINKIKEAIGWEPKVSVEEGVKKLVKWVMENKNLFT